MCISSECCVLSSRSLCDGPITRPEESCRVWCVSECDSEVSTMRRPWPTGGLSSLGKLLEARGSTTQVLQMSNLGVLPADHPFHQDKCMRKTNEI